MIESAAEQRERLEFRGLSMQEREQNLQQALDSFCDCVEVERYEPLESEEIE
jgi:hypothetical protein